MTETATIRRRPDGSIDTAFYMAAGRLARSERAHSMVADAASAVASAARPADDGRAAGRLTAQRA